MVVFRLRQSGLAILNELEELELDNRTFTKEELEKKRNIFNRHKVTVRKGLAWERLFLGMSLEEIIYEINDVWINPEYRLVVEVQAKKIFAKRS